MKGRLGTGMLLVAILATEATLSRIITGVGLHQALVVIGVVLFLGLRLLGHRIARWAGWTVAVGLAFSGARLMDSGAVPVMLSELGWPFHLALGWHFGLWTSTLGGRGGGGRSPGRGELGGGALAGILVFWNVGNVEIYGGSVLGVRLLASFVLIASFWLAWRASSERISTGGKRTVGMRVGPSDIRSRPSGGWITTAVATVTVIALVLAAVFSIPLADRVALWSYGILGSDRDTTDLGAFNTEVPVADGSGGFSDSSMRQLPRRADLRLDDSVRFHLWFEDLDQMTKSMQRVLYLRTSTMGHFSSDGGMGPVRLGDWIYDSDDGNEDGITLLRPGSVPPPGEPVEFWTLIGPNEARELPHLPATEAVGLAGVYAFAEDWYQLALEEHQNRVRFRVQAVMPEWESLVRDPEIAKGETSLDYLQLPNSALTARILELANDSAPREWTLDRRLEAIRGIMRDRCRYSLSYDNPRDLDPVENFLFGEGRGHCELFAVSTAMLLRAIGVPARVAFGFSGGEYSPARRLVAFRQSDFHAWAEIYLSELGWVVFDTTPDGSGAAGPARRNPGSPAFSAVDLAAFEDLGGERLLGKVELSWWTRTGISLIEFISRGFVWICAAAAIATLGVWWHRRWRGKSRGTVPAPAPYPVEPEAGRRAGTASTTSLLQEFLGACAARGREKRPGETLNEFLQALKRDGSCGDELDSMTAYLYRVGYADVPSDPEQERGFREVIRSWLRERPAEE